MTKSSQQFNPNDTAKPKITDFPTKERSPTHLCHIHNNIKPWVDVDYVHQNVCVSAEESEKYEIAEHLTEYEGEHYCLFHLPTKDKNVAKFNAIFHDRIKKVDQECAAIKAEFPFEVDQIKAKDERNIYYDFRYIWFPSANYLRYPGFTAHANFSSATFESSVDFSNKRFKSSVDFSEATFKSSLNFSKAEFELGSWFRSAKFESSADFSSTTFTITPDFDEAKFEASANFSSAKFITGAEFESVIFTAGADFNSALFRWSANFSLAEFGKEWEVSFRKTRFDGTLNLSNAKIKGYVRFEGSKDNRVFVDENSSLDLQDAQIDDVKKIFFYGVRLEPSWFVTVDASEIIFTDCYWKYRYGRRLNVKEELENFKYRKFENPNPLLTKACWQLATNYEESKDFALASEFREIAQESKRLKNVWWKQPFTLHWWYWLSSFYGESWRHAFLVLALIIFAIFPLIYTQIEFQVTSKNIPLEVVVAKNCKELVFEELQSNCQIKPPHGLHFWNGEALAHSLSTATLQTVEYRIPITKWGSFWVILEKIFAPLQAALLALAIRRKFMR